jgi:tetratricopeptide (TPR) repeat protein
VNLKNYEANVAIQNQKPDSRKNAENNLRRKERGASFPPTGELALGEKENDSLSPGRFERWISRWCALLTGNNLWLLRIPEREGQGGVGRMTRWRSALQPPTSLWENLLRLAILGLVLLTLALSAHACGPDFPNNLLTGGDEALLAAPVADFQHELARLDLLPGRFAHVTATNGYEQLTLDAEMNDLVAALKKAKVSPEDSALIVEAHRVNRNKLNRYREACRKWEANVWMEADEGARNRRGPQPVFPLFAEVTGLPVEFSDYFAGAAAICNLDGDAVEEREPWERLLARPAAERKYKSTWAAFMLGKSWEGEDDDKAVEYFQMARDLAKRGFTDSTGLAVAAIGLEARIEFRRKNFKRAIELYLEQYAAGDDSAVVSLQWVSAAALAAGGNELTVLAASSNTRSVMTAYLICNQRGGRYADSGSPTTNPATAWLEAVEAQDVNDVESAERLALAAYQEGEFEVAQRWIERARRTPVSQWLQAKLFLRAGKVPEAAALLAKVANLLPVLPASETNETTQFADGLRMANDSSDRNSARKQVLGELGALRLSRREFTQALDALLNAGFWQDAAYVAERVLMTDELKAYVNKSWPPINTGIADQTESGTGDEVLRPDSTKEDIRYLLARRLTREMRSSEAREYYPAAWQPRFDELVKTLNEGWDESAPATQRAKALFASAIIARTNGMELLGTELAPDWFVNRGSFDSGLTWEERASAARSGQVNIASEVELDRAARHCADPEVRFHYRYQAAFLAWEAAKLMPNNSDETARVLCAAGTWLKVRDPATADLFYKALVRRCRQTAIGEQANRMRWFPMLDERGNPKPYKPKREESLPSTIAEEADVNPNIGENVPVDEPAINW